MIWSHLSRSQETVTLALGIGATTAIFSLVNAVLLRPPAHVVHPEELVSVFTSDYSGPPYGTSSHPDFEAFREDTPALAAAVSVDPWVLNMAGDDGLVRSHITEFVSGNYFEMLGVPMSLGRGFIPEEGDFASGLGVVVVSHGFWTRELGSDPGAVGRTLRLSGHTLTVVGVAPEAFVGSLPAVSTEFWAPPATESLIRGEETFRQRGDRGTFIRARLAPGATVESAQQQLTTLASRLQEQYPRQWTDVRGDTRRITVVPDARLPPQMKGAVNGFAALLLAVVGIVLLIACANVANLTLARAIARGREIAIRVSMGAGRGRVVRQLLTESALLGLVGGVAGLAMAWFLVGLAGSLKPVAGVAVTVDLGIDGRVLAVSVAVTLLTVMAVGLVPALRASCPDLVSSLKDGAEASAGRFRWFHLRNLLVLAQVSASLVLLVGAGLFLKSLRAAVSVDPGFTVDGIAAVSLDLEPEGYSRQDALRFFEALRARLDGRADVLGTGIIDALPMTLGAGKRSGVSITGYTPGEGEDMEFQYFALGDGLVEALGMHLVAGRTFTAAEAEDAPLTVLVNRSFADRFWPGESALGKTLTWNGDNPAEVVGVLEDAMYRSLTDTDRPAYFIPVGQRPSASLTLVARTDPALVDELLATMKDEVRAADPRLTGISSLQSMQDAIAFTLLPQRIASGLLSLAGGLGLLLATVGLYGVMSFLVERRIREVGLRMALGARAADVVGMVVGRGLRVAAAGAVVGLALAAVVTRFLASQLFGVSPLDLSVFAVMGLGAMSVAAVACSIPARRAASVDPAVALREE